MVSLSTTYVRNKDIRDIVLYEQDSLSMENSTGTVLAQILLERFY